MQRACSERKRPAMLAVAVVAPSGGVRRSTLYRQTRSIWKTLAVHDAASPSRVEKGWQPIVPSNSYFRYAWISTVPSGPEIVVLTSRSRGRDVVSVTLVGSAAAGEGHTAARAQMDEPASRGAHPLCLVLLCPIVSSRIRFPGVFHIPGPMCRSGHGRGRARPPSFSE